MIYYRPPTRSECQAWASAHVWTVATSLFSSWNRGELPISDFSRGGRWKGQLWLTHGEEQGLVALACCLAADTLLYIAADRAVVHVGHRARLDAALAPGVALSVLGNRAVGRPHAM